MPSNIPAFAQDALYHINRLTCAGNKAEPLVQTPATSHGHTPCGPQPRGWLGSLAAAASSVLSPQRLLGQNKSALPTPPTVAAAPALPHSRVLVGDGLLGAAAAEHRLRCRRRFRLALDSTC